MNKDKGLSKNIKKLLILGGVILAIVILIFADKAFKKDGTKENNNNVESSEAPDGIKVNLGDESDVSAEEEETDEASEDGKNEDNKSEDDKKDEVSSDKASNEDDKSEDDKKDEVSSDKVSNEDNKSEDDKKDEVTSDKGSNEDDLSIDEDIFNKSETSYEKWLAATAITAISMYYYENEFDIKEVYLASQNVMGNHKDSEGVYVVFTVDGEEKIVHCKPIEIERDAVGTIDIEEQHTGFATFDIGYVKPSVLENCEQVNVESLSGLINQLMLVTLYEH